MPQAIPTPVGYVSLLEACVLRTEKRAKATQPAVHELVFHKFEARIRHSRPLIGLKRAMESKKVVLEYVYRLASRKSMLVLEILQGGSSD